MKNLDLNDWLRYFLSGAIVVILFVYILNNSGTNKEIIVLKKQITELDKTYVKIGILLIIGAIIYSLHRAIVYPLILWLFQLIFSGFMKERKFSCDLIWPFRPSKTEIKDTLGRWKHSSSGEQKEEKERFVRKLSEWAGQIHFLYCTSWSILLMDVFLIKKFNLSGYEWIGCFFWIFLIASIIHHLRYFYFETKVLQ